MTLGAIEESRLKGGTLTLAGVAFAKQATDVSLVPTVNQNGDTVETLSGATLNPEESYTWVLSLGFIQDFVDPAGLVRTLNEDAGTDVAFAWTPNGDEGPAYSGTVTMRPTTVGGTVATRLTGTVDLPVKGQPVVGVGA